ncbi:hypothetical protein GWK47_033219 [Chionoecetes opilio]|uniref:Uncharacterized protein n=1 Tax=Chionoecetes opilio TaxID=41210 RepID=A0A8J4YH35_CHIOP|nr:hypothetical protein GWK47_033219 [Chionoecetes opilio]
MIHMCFLSQKGVVVQQMIREVFCSVLRFTSQHRAHTWGPGAGGGAALVHPAFTALQDTFREFETQAAFLHKCRLIMLLPATHAAARPHSLHRSNALANTRLPVLREPSGMPERARSVPGGAAGLDCDLSICNSGDSQDTREPRVALTLCTGR